MRQSLPFYLKNFHAFQTGRQIATEMLSAFRNGKEVDKLLANFLQEDRGNDLQTLLACEVIADSRGHDCGFRYWNVPVKRMLKQSRFVASQQLAMKGFGRVERLLSNATGEAEWQSELRNLLNRLNASAQSSDLDGLKLTKSQYKKISVGLTTDDYGFGIVKNKLAFYNPTFERALEATALDPSVVNEFSGKFAAEPSEEDTECTKLVLNYFCDTLTSVRCDAQRYYASDRKTTRQSIQFWADLKPQLERLTRLQRFETTDLVVSEELALSLLELPELGLLRVMAFSPGVYEKLHFGARLISAALAKESLRVLSLPHLSDELIEMVRAAPSRPLLQVNLKMVADESEGRGKSITLSR